MNVAVVARDGPIWAANLALRDYLRTDTRAAAEYAAVKLSAIENGKRTLLAYSNFKSAVVEELIRRALQAAS